MDIALLLESHRTNLLKDLNGRLEGHHNLTPYQIVEICYDRATIKTLLDNISNGQQPAGHAVTGTNTTTITTRRVKAGSKKARDRALKAGETRRRNLAAKAGQGNLAPAGGATNSNESEATFRSEGGGQ